MIATAFAIGDFRTQEMIEADPNRKKYLVAHHLRAATADVRTVLDDLDQFQALLSGKPAGRFPNQQYSHKTSGGHDIAQYVHRQIPERALHRLPSVIEGLRVLGESNLADNLAGCMARWHSQLAEIRFHSPRRMPSSNRVRHQVTEFLLPSLRLILTDVDVCLRSVQFSCETVGVDPKCFRSTHNH